MALVLASGHLGHKIYSPIIIAQRLRLHDCHVDLSVVNNTTARQFVSMLPIKLLVGLLVGDFI